MVLVQNAKLKNIELIQLDMLNCYEHDNNKTVAKALRSLDKYLLMLFKT